MILVHTEVPLGQWLKFLFARPFKGPIGLVQRDDLVQIPSTMSETEIKLLALEIAKLLRTKYAQMGLIPLSRVSRNQVAELLGIHEDTFKKNFLDIGMIQEGTDGKFAYKDVQGLLERIAGFRA